MEQKDLASANLVKGSQHREIWKFPQPIRYVKMKLDKKNIFLVDGVGATLSALSTGLLLPLLYQWTGVPLHVSLPLAFLGFLFAACSVSCFWFVQQPRPALLMAMMGANLFYCAVSIAIIVNLDGIKDWGRAFLFAEALAIAAIIVLEAAVLKRSY